MTSAVPLFTYYYVKTWFHTQNWKYIVCRNVIWGVDQATRNMYRKFWEGHAFFEVCKRTEQTDIQTDTQVTILCPPAGGKVEMVVKMLCLYVCVCTQTGFDRVQQADEGSSNVQLEQCFQRRWGQAWSHETARPWRYDAVNVTSVLCLSVELGLPYLEQLYSSGICCLHYRTRSCILHTTFDCIIVYSHAIVVFEIETRRLYCVEWHNTVFARSGPLSVHQLITYCIVWCLVSHAGNWLLSALSAALHIFSFQFSLLFFRISVAR